MGEPRRKDDEHEQPSLSVEFAFESEPEAKDRAPDDMLPLIAKAVVDAAWDGNYGRVKTALEKFPLTENVTQGALTAACEKGNYEIAELLLEHGVDPNGLKGAPLAGAAFMGHMEIIELLLEHGADPACNFYEALNIAAMQGNIGATVILLDHNGPEALDAVNRIAIAEAGHTNIAEIIQTRIRERDGKLFGETADNDNDAESPAPEKSEKDAMYDKALGKIRRRISYYNR